MKSSPDIFCAIDTPDTDEAVDLITRLSPVLSCFKLGLEFFVAQGPDGIAKARRAAGAKAKIFLDLKLHDIPNTVAGAVRSAVRAQVDFLTIHTSGGRAMMMAAMAAAADEAAARGVTPPKILGVTVLTNLDSTDLESVGQMLPPRQQVLKLAQLAMEAKLDGLVCSSHELSVLREALGYKPVLVVPGIRPAGADAGDQKRIMTPKEALALGASYLVIGRPITLADDPVAAARAIVESL